MAYKWTSITAGTTPIKAAIVTEMYNAMTEKNNAVGGNLGIKSKLTTFNNTYTASPLFGMYASAKSLIQEIDAQNTCTNDTDYGNKSDDTRYSNDAANEGTQNFYNFNYYPNKNDCAVVD